LLLGGCIDGGDGGAVEKVNEEIDDGGRGAADED
jgi:hypothetical protein